MASEIGGANGVLPIAWAAQLGLPLVDADGMGRAFPEVPKVSMNVAGIAPRPVGAVRRARQRRSRIRRASRRLGRADRARPVRSRSAARAIVGGLLMTAAQARGAIDRAARSRWAMAIGRAMAAPSDPVAALVAEVGARAADRAARSSTSSGARPAASPAAASRSRAWRGRAGALLRLEIQNENLVALEDGAGAGLGARPDHRARQRDGATRSRPSCCATASG